MGTEAQFCIKVVLEPFLGGHTQEQNWMKWARGDGLDGMGHPGDTVPCFSQAAVSPAEDTKDAV